MKTRIPTKPLVALVATALLVASPLATADVRYGEPNFSTMVIDAVVARPLGLGATVVGTAFWIVTLPFSALGGNVGEATDKLIVEPARYTFVRPLGEL
ncbi:MAG: hypothetical protein JNK40_09775 [Chromatiales bacterium]|nr:hypothetical protein [Chromatiales bacterium]